MMELSGDIVLIHGLHLHMHWVGLKNRLDCNAMETRVR